jgi:hypothetical protein
MAVIEIDAGAGEENSGRSAIAEDILMVARNQTNLDRAIRGRI